MSNIPAPQKKAARRAALVEVVTGLFIAVLFIGLGIFTIVISGSTLFNSRLFPITVIMDNANGIAYTDPVFARGTKVGRVNRVHFETDGVHVDAMLDAPVVFHEGYTIRVDSSSILGGHRLVIDEGPADAPPVKDLSHLVGSTPSDLMSDAADIVSHVKTGEGPLGRIIYDDAMASNLVEAIANLRSVAVDISNFTARVTSGEGTLGRLTYDDALAGDISTGIADLRAAAANISNMTARIESGEGTLGRLFYDDAMAADLTNAVSSIKTVAARLENGEGTLGKLLDPNDTQAWDDLKDSIANLKSITARLENGEGTLGKLLSSDTEVYDNLNGVLKDGREVIDDMREASPVSTFSSVILGAF